ncbi:MULTISPECIES: hypothetical protein [Streptomyces]|jgi:hypothetical protein|uniref:Uncharacterized protein n=1 Tax=Streptomyces mirabilis TaxID=68239 RepID=A0ABU3V008_9ACTN|nr:MULTISPECIES: hypothetical protein [Streptomyces]MCX4616056.1 hypothetical protein [Streptomyces mirabilis]MCX5347168.1 hypothetical protein [Streptomyces mirabilis]MDU8999514.1 hypothetical protein [Streptomyces mirabilis]QDN85889.1 hypothetical protein FNV61_10025 [Streptomyces sp. RLB3-6]QDO06701.1 hypothetical protein FNV68_11135 [Streptomyces sp. S1D4-23]
MTVADWLKFTPGWLAFLVTMVTLIRKTWTVRQNLALGPEASSLRTQLIQFRALLEEVSTKYTDWFLHEDRREVARALRDSAERRDDETLQLAMTRVADAWDELFALAPAPRVRSPWVGGAEETRHRREDALGAASDLDQFHKMTEVARSAMVDVEIAIGRLNELERRTHGR